MSDVEAYCPACDKTHRLHVWPGRAYHCAEKGDFVMLSHGYAGYRISVTGSCKCPYDHLLFGEHGIECYRCLLPKIVRHYNVLMPNFIRQMWYEAREGAGGRGQEWDRFRVTFPHRFMAIVSESNAANASALAQHLPQVLTTIVRDYLTHPYG